MVFFDEYLIDRIITTSGTVLQNIVFTSKEGEARIGSVLFNVYEETKLSNGIFGYKLLQRKLVKRKVKDLPDLIVEEIVGFVAMSDISIITFGAVESLGEDDLKILDIKKIDVPD